MAVRPQRSLSSRRLAPLALMPTAAFAVHQLRYWLAFGGRAAAQLEAQGHAYLHSLAPWIVMLLAIGAGIFLRALGRALRGWSSLRRYTVSFVGLWLLCSACLVAIYVCQELLEGMLVTGHPAGAAGVFGAGGWWAVPAALAVGLVLAALLHGARWLLCAIALRSGRRRPRARPTSALRVPAGAPRLRPAPLAVGWSGRGPPR
jgi:hypothetical protein